MPHELLIPADALARINMLFRMQKNATEPRSLSSTKNSEAGTDVERDPSAQAESTNRPAPK